MKISARNILSATVKAVTPGAVDTKVVRIRIEMPPSRERTKCERSPPLESLCYRDSERNRLKRVDINVCDAGCGLAW